MFAWHCRGKKGDLPAAAAGIRRLSGLPGHVDLAGGVPRHSTRHQRTLRPPATAHLARGGPADPGRSTAQPRGRGDGRQRRWAKQRGSGPHRGPQDGRGGAHRHHLRAIELGIKHLSVYAFSTENWKRSAEEVRFLMGSTVRGPAPPRSPDPMGVNMRWSVWPKMCAVSSRNRHRRGDDGGGNDVITVNYCVNYGGRTEIVEATRQIAQLAADGRLSPDRISEATLERYLQRPDIPDVDLFIRTSASSGPAISCCGNPGLRRVRVPGQARPDRDRRDHGRRARSTCRATDGWRA